MADEQMSTIELLRWACVDYDGAEMPDGAEPRDLAITCGDLRKIADEIDECHRVILEQSREITALEREHATLRSGLRFGEPEKLYGKGT